MTLVIGNTTGTQAFLLADTLITSPMHGTALSDSQLKIAFPMPGIAVGFAGDPDIAEQDVSDFKAQNDGSFAATKTFFSSRSAASHNDYLISFGATGNILRCRLSGADKPLATPWVGDHAAFNAYQSTNAPETRSFVPGPGWTMDTIRAGLEHALKPMRQLRRVIELRATPSVGHFVSIAAHTAEGFRFCIQSTTYADRISNLIDKNGHHSLMSLGENAEYRLVTCPAKPAGVSAAVFAYPHANKAFLYASPGSNFGRYNRTYDLPLDDALKAAHQDTGIEFDLVDVRMSPP